jgi:hypothetical protein
MKEWRMKGLTKEWVKERTKECMDGNRKDGLNAKSWKEGNYDEVRLKKERQKEWM